MSLFWTSDGRGASGAVSAAERSESAAEGAVSQVKRLESRLNQLTLVNMALWSLLKEKAGLTEDDLLARVEEIDLRDGKLDGKLSEQAVTCPNCGRTLSKKHDRCLYCGFEAATDAFGYAIHR